MEKLTLMNTVKQIYQIYAGGDCAIGGDDLTVTAVAQGRDAAVHINTQLMK